MLSPEELRKWEFDNTDFEALEAEIDADIKKYHNQHVYEQAYLDANIGYNIAEELARRYHAAGWHAVYYKEPLLKQFGGSDEEFRIHFVFSETELDCFNNYTALADTY